MVHYVSTPALVQAKQCSSEMTFGEILKKAGAVGDMRDCPVSFYCLIILIAEL